MRNQCTHIAHVHFNTKRMLSVRGCVMAFVFWVWFCWRTTKTEKTIDHRRHMKRNAHCHSTIITSRKTIVRIVAVASVDTAFLLHDLDHIRNGVRKADVMVHVVRMMAGRPPSRARRSNQRRSAVPVTERQRDRTIVDIWWRISTWCRFVPTYRKLGDRRWPL